MTLVCYHGMFSFAFSKNKLLFITPPFKKQLPFPKLNCFLLPLHLKTNAFFHKFNCLNTPQKSGSSVPLGPVRIIYARTIFERQKLKYLTELEIYLFVSTFIYFHTLCLRDACTLVCLGVCADSSKCSLLADAVSTVCRPNISTNPKPFSAIIAYPGYQAFPYA